MELVLSRQRVIRSRLSVPAKQFRYRPYALAVMLDLFGFAQLGTAGAQSPPLPQASKSVPSPGDITPSRTGQPPSKRAAGYEFAPGEVCPFCALTPQSPKGQSGLHWHDHWSTVGTREYITVPLIGAATLALELLVKPDSAPTWNRPILFDADVRDVLRLESAGARKAARTISDVLLIGSFTQPMLVDTLVVAWWQRQAPRVAWQMSVINAQAYAFTFALNAATKRLTSRARPWVAECDRDPSGESCGTGGAYRSFYSGHAAITATGAGLVCAHHTQLSLYQSNALDAGSCAVAILGTAVTGALRIASDDHWASDVLIGNFMGYLSGYLLPTLLYYKEFRVTPDEHLPPGSQAPVVAVLPMITVGSAQAVLVGAF